MALPKLLRNCLRTEFAREPHALLHRRIHLIRPGDFLPFHRYQNATPFSTFSGHRALLVETDISSQQTLNPEPDQPSPSQRQEKTQDQKVATPKPKRKASTAESLASGGSRTAHKRPSGSSRAKTQPDIDRAPVKAIPKKKKPEKWQIQKAALKEKFQEGWNPTKKLSPDALEGIRHLHSIAPDKFTTPVLAEQFEVSPEAIRRILKSKWRASAAELENRRERWERRHDRIWSHLTQLGLRPQTKRSAPFDDVGILYEKRGGEKQ